MKNVLFFLLFISAYSGLFAQDNYFQQEVNTKVTAALDARTNSIDGHADIQYQNLSPDTLRFIWFLLAPNAFKNDRSAFSEYLLEKDRTDFYFSGDEKKGYINRIEFRAEDEILETQDHPQYIELVKVLLNEPLPPGQKTTISTPFHVRIPYNFDGFGYSKSGFQLNYWFPTPLYYSSLLTNKPDWLIKPFTDQKTYFVQPSNVTVQITIPAGYSIKTRAAFSDSIQLNKEKKLQYQFRDAHDFLMTISNGKRLPQKQMPKNYDSLLLTSAYKLFDHPILPAVGFNVYDGLQLGLLIQNMKRHENKLKFYAAPVFGLNSKKLIGAAGFDYRLDAVKNLKQVNVGLDAGLFSIAKANDKNREKIFGQVIKIAPYLRLTFPARNTHIEKTAEYKLFLLNEKQFDYTLSESDSQFYPFPGKNAFTYINQLSFRISNSRVLYPFSGELQFQQAAKFYRINAEAKYFFNYPAGGGLRMRMFASKFGYIGNFSRFEKFGLSRYMPKLTAIRGSEDYTYSNYFIARNDFNSFSNQVMNRDGNLKLRTDLFDGLQGRSDNWIASINVNSTLPKITPVAIPLQAFLDVGTYSDVWDRQSSDPRFLFVAGLQLSLLHEVINIYAPLLYSSYFRDQLKTVPEENTFFKRISFSIDLAKIPRKQNYSKSPGRIL